ncbi:MAG: hypothetical protein QOG40_2374 [Solirubrobacteraceae bacterium]|nr:hypothetical protein [Solirubrobacteraceae bacterium]
MGGAELDAAMSDPLAERPAGMRGQRGLQLRLDRFAWRAIGEECSRLGISAEELSEFAVLYYLADLDSGRIARQLPGYAGKAGSARAVAGAASRLMSSADRARRPRWCNP